MKKIKIIIGALVVGLVLNGLQSCKKSNPSVKDAEPNEAVTNSPSQARMWTSGKQIYSVTHNAPGQAFLKFMTPPPSVIHTFAPGVPFKVGATPVTYVTGIAYCAGQLVICTGLASNFPTSLLIYNPPFTALTTPTIKPSKDLSDIEFNEYDGQLYGIFANQQIVQISLTSPLVTVNLSPVIPAGSKLMGLCNYSGLLSYCISDGIIFGAGDNFYSYNPASPALTTPLFTTEWGIGDGGMQYCGGAGWEIVTYNDFPKNVPPPHTGIFYFGPLIPGAPYRTTDLTSN